jgi:hypothetical protein
MYSQMVTILLVVDSKMIMEFTVIIKNSIGMKETGSTENLMESANNIQIVERIKGTFCLGRRMGKGNIVLKTDSFIKDNFYITRLLEEELYLILIKTIYIMVILKMA